MKKIKTFHFLFFELTVEIHLQALRALLSFYLQNVSPVLIDSAHK